MKLGYPYTEEQSIDDYSKIPDVLTFHWENPVLEIERIFQCFSLFLYYLSSGSEKNNGYTKWQLNRSAQWHNAL